MSTDLTFITNESGKSLHDRFGVLLSDGTRLFDCLVGYFFISDAIGAVAMILLLLLAT